MGKYVLTAPTAASIAADFLDKHAGTLVESWIEWVRNRITTNTVNALPERALRNHIPPILSSLAQFLREPIELARSEMLGNLRLHGQIRRDQGFSLEEVLAEFDGLAEVVTESVMQELLSQKHDFEASDLLKTTQRLSSGLRSISYIAMGTYARSDAERAHQMAENLEHLARAIMHEMSNPLNTISLGLDVISDRQENTSSAAQVDAMRAAVRRCKYLLDTMRVLTVAENARAGSNMVELPDAVTRIIREFERSTKAAGIEVIRDEMPELRVEAILLYIILANVISNSIKYSDPDKSEKFVKIGASYNSEEHDSGFCVLVIEDNGIGIPDEFLPRVMQKGFRGHPGHADGTGIGLYLVQQSAAARGGSVTIESEEGQGTKVTVRMRCLNPASDAITADTFQVDHLMGEIISNEASDNRDSPRAPKSD
jgi:signal transduction histidine kinase